MASLSAALRRTLLRTRCTFWLASGCAVLSCLSLGAAPPQLLTGKPRVPDVPSSDSKVIRIVADVDADEEVRVYPDRILWMHHSGEVPASVKINNVPWNLKLKMELTQADEPAIIPESFHQLGAAIDVVYGRGYITFHGRPDALQVLLTDPDAGGAPADFVLRPGEELADHEPDPRNVARIAQLVGSHTKRPHPRGPEAKTRRDLKKVQERWARKCYAGAYEEFGNRDPKWDAQAIKFLEAAVAVPIGSRDELIKAGDELLDLGCDDPLVCGVLGEILWKNRNPSRAEPLIRHAVLGVEKGRYPPRSTRRLPAILARLIRRRSAEDWRLGEQLYARCIAETVQTLCDKLEGEERRALFLELSSEFNQGGRDLFRGHRPQLIREISETPEVDPWMSHMLQAWYLHDQGWHARGDGWGSTESGWQNFRRLLAQSRAHAVDAWGLIPEHPESSMLMIATVQAVGGVAEDTHRFWFDQAVASQMDVFPVHYSLMNTLLPRWGGSHESMIEFGVECLRTGRYDTIVPLTIWNAVWGVHAEGGDPLALLTEQNAVDELIPAMEAICREENEWVPLGKRQTENALMAYALGMTDEARKYLEAAGPNLDSECLRNRGVDGEILRFDILTPTKSAKEAPTRAPLGTLLETPGKVRMMDISSAGDMIAVASRDDEHLLTLWDLQSGKSEAMPVESRVPPANLRFSGDGKYLAGLLDGEMTAMDGSRARWGAVTIWNLTDHTSRDLIPRAQHTPYGITWLRDHRHVASSIWNGPVKIWNVETQRVEAQTEGPASAVAIEISLDGKVLAVGRADGIVRLYALPEPRELEGATEKDLPKIAPIGDLQKHLKIVTQVEFSPDGRWLASSYSEDRFVWLWDLVLRKPANRFEGVTAAFSPDSRRLATAGGPRLKHQIAVWDLETGDALCRLVNSDSASPRRLAFTADGSFVVAGGDDSAIRTWDVRMEVGGPAKP